MTDATTQEGWHTVEDGAKLYTKTWKPAGVTKAKIVFVHGFSDHCNTYGTLFPTLASRGIETFAFDQRGWGRSIYSPSQRGLTGPTSRVLADITSILQTVIPSPVPLFLMGHSMGGAEVLIYAAQGPPSVLKHIHGFLVEGPFIALYPATRPYKLTVIAGRLAGKMMPHMQMNNKIDEKLLTRDPVVQRQIADDELCHDIGTLEGLAGMLDRAADLESGKVRVREGVGEGGKTRVWVGHGTQDGVCSFEGTKRWFEELEVEDKELKAYEGWFHRLNSEPGENRIMYANDVADWILARCSASSSETDETSSRPKL